MNHKKLLSSTAVAVSLATATAAFAQPSAEKAAAAQVLFDEGMKLMASGQFAAACPKLKSAQNLDPGMATQFRLAECYEKLGATASAWALYVEVAEAAKAAKGRDREALARKRAKVLEPRLSRMTITVAPEASDLAGLTVKRDGILLEKPLWGTAVPVDPGEHLVTVTAPGKKTWEGKGTIAGPAGALNVTIPALEDAPKAPDASASLAASSSGTGERNLALVEASAPRRSALPAIIAGVGAAGAVGVGLALYASAEGKRASVLQSPLAQGSCLGTVRNPGCDEIKVTAHAVDTFHNVAIGAFVGAGVVAAGALIYVLWPNPPTKKPTTAGLHVAPLLGPGLSGVIASGAF